MTWFEEVFGFEESDYSPLQIRTECFEEYFDSATAGVRHLRVKVGRFSGKTFRVGSFETASVSDLLPRLLSLPAPHLACAAPAPALPSSPLSFSNVTADVRSLHLSSSSSYSRLFGLPSPVVLQAASQFNALEMVGPSVTPEQGVTNYIRDRTQGPACAMSAPAGLVFRNYMVGVAGQCDGPQINLAEDVERLLDNEKKNFWTMRNGYLLPNEGKMKSLREILEKDEKEGGGELSAALVNATKVAVHWDVDVYSPPQHRETLEAYTARLPKQVSQVYCSACPVSYSKVKTTVGDWAPFAKLNLEGMYKATFAAAAVIARQYKEAAKKAAEKGDDEAAAKLNEVRVKLYLTQVGGGVFGNQESWIVEAVEKAIAMFKGEEVDVITVHYSPPAEDSRFLKLENQLKSPTSLSGARK